MSAILTVEQAAAKLQVRPNTVRDWLKKGRIPGRKIGRVYRILESDIEAFVHCALLQAGGAEGLSRRLRAADVIGLFADASFTSEDLMRERQQEIDREEQAKA